MGEPAGGKVKKLEHLAPTEPLILQTVEVGLTLRG